VRVKIKKTIGKKYHPAVDIKAGGTINVEVLRRV